MKYARIVDSIAVEVFTPPEGFTFEKCFTAELVAQFVPCSEEVEAGWIEQENGSFNPPVPTPPVPVPEPTLAPDYIAFWDALMVSTVYAAIREQSFVSLPMNTLATEFIALLGDAKAGRPNETAIQASMDAILLNGTFTNDQLTELAGALETSKLDSLYTLV
jgi:hypothetical protein